MRSTRAIRTRKVRGTIYKANFQQGALVINNELRDFRVFLNFVVRLEILAGAKFLLFLNWLRFELNHGWAEIVASGAPRARSCSPRNASTAKSAPTARGSGRAERDAVVPPSRRGLSLGGRIEAMHFTYSGALDSRKLDRYPPPSSKSWPRFLKGRADFICARLGAFSSRVI
jgi:hypothetical protein